MITTRTKIKSLLGITEATYDTRIDDLLQPIQDDILSFLKNKFASSDIYLIASTISFTGTTILDSLSKFVTAGFVAGDINVYGSKLNDGFYTLSTVAAGTLTISEALKTEAAGNTIKISQVLYPKGLELVFANMIGYTLYKKHGVVSESISRYSVTYSGSEGSLINGYPDSVTRPLLKWRKPYGDY